jgi:hypothetical protein
MKRILNTGRNQDGSCPLFMGGCPVGLRRPGVDLVNLQAKRRLATEPFCRLNTAASVG